MIPVPPMRTSNLPSGVPIHTAVARYGVKPTNHPSLASCAVPVFPAAC